MKKIFGLFAILFVVAQVSAAGSGVLDNSWADSTALGTYDWKLVSSYTTATSVTGTTPAYIEQKVRLAAGWEYVIVGCDSIGAQADSITYAVQPYYYNGTDTVSFTINLGVAAQSGSYSYHVFKIPVGTRIPFALCNLRITRTAATNVTKHRSHAIWARRIVNWTTPR